MAQGGSTSATSTASSSGYQPISTEPVQQLAFTGQSQLAMANTGQPNSTDAQFFITNAVQPTATQQALDFGYTIFGQLVAGQQTLDNLSHVAVQKSSTNELSLPINPVTITAATLSSTNVNGVVHVDTTSARAGETAHITVTATDPQDGSQVTRTFAVTVSAYNGPTQPLINFKPFAADATATTDQDVATTITVTGQSGFPDTNYPGVLSYAIVTQPAHGTISQFDASTGRLVYTPAAGYYGCGFVPVSGDRRGAVERPAEHPQQAGECQHHDQRGTASTAPTSASATSAATSASACELERRQGESQQAASTGADRTELQWHGERRSGPADRDVPPGPAGDSRVVHRQERQGAGSEIGPLRPDHPDGRPHPQEPVGPHQDRTAPDRRPVGRERSADRRRPERLGRRKCSRDFAGSRQSLGSLHLRPDREAEGARSDRRFRSRGSHPPGWSLVPISCATIGPSSWPTASFPRPLAAVGIFLAQELLTMSPNLNRRQFTTLGAASLAALSIGAAPPKTPGARKPVVIASGNQKTAEIAMEMIRKGADPLDAVIAGRRDRRGRPQRPFGRARRHAQRGRGRRARRLGHARADPRRRGGGGAAEHRPPGRGRPVHHEADQARPARRRQRAEVRQGARLPRAGPAHRRDPAGLDRLERSTAPRLADPGHGRPARPGRTGPGRPADSRDDPLLRRSTPTATSAP